MNLLSTLFTLAQDAPTKTADVEPDIPFIGPGGYLEYWQLLLLLVLIGLIVFYMIYKKKQNA